LNLNIYENGAYAAGIHNGGSSGHGLLIEAGVAGNTAHYPLKIQDRLSSSDLLVVNAAGDLAISGHMTGGGTRGYFDGGESGTFSTSRYLDFNNGTQMGATIGYRMHRAGSITGVSCQFNVTSQTDGFDTPFDQAYSLVRTEVRKNGTNVFYVDESPTSTGNKGDSATQARGTDTFAAGDVLTLYVTITNNGGYMGATSAVTCDDFNAFMEVTFDT